MAITLQPFFTVMLVHFGIVTMSTKIWAITTSLTKIITVMIKAIVLVTESKIKSCSLKVLNILNACSNLFIANLSPLPIIPRLIWTKKIAIQTLKLQIHLTKLLTTTLKRLTILIKQSGNFSTI